MPGPTVALTSLRTERATSHWRRMVPLVVHLWKSLEAYLLASVGVRSEERKNIPTNVNRCKVWAGYKRQERPKWLDLSSHMYQKSMETCEDTVHPLTSTYNSKIGSSFHNCLNQARQSNQQDLRGVPTSQCFCGENWTVHSWPLQSPAPAGFTNCGPRCLQ